MLFKNLLVRVNEKLNNKWMDWQKIPALTTSGPSKATFLLHNVFGIIFVRSGLQGVQFG